MAGADVLELRVHGVGGPTAAQVLGPPERVWGDDDGRLAVYRRSQESEGNVEVFLWGGLTRPRRALAFLRAVLLPFALVNVAGWMIPRPGVGTGEVPPEGRRLSLSMLVLIQGVMLHLTYACWLVVLVVDVPRLAMATPEARLRWSFLGWAAVALLVLGPLGLRLRQSVKAPERNVFEPPASLASPGFWTAPRQTIGVYVAESLLFAAAIGWLHLTHDEDLPMLPWLLGFQAFLCSFVVWSSRRATRGERPTAHVPLLLAMSLAVTLTSVVFAGAAAVLASALDVPLHGSERSLLTPAVDTTFVLRGPEVVQAALLGLFAGAGGVFALVRMARRAKAVNEPVDADGDDRTARRWKRRQRLARRLAYLAEDAVGQVQLPVVAALWTAWAVGFLWWLPEAVAARVLTALTGGLAFSAVVVVTLAFAVRPVREAIRTAWDVLTFWPLRYHPLAPECYAARAVPALAGRLAERAPVVVCAHSQGSVLAFAALQLVEDDVAARVALVTYGSPLRTLYAAVFPAYFGAEAFATLRERLGGRWTNVYRDTDPIGGPVLSGEGDLAIAEPPYLPGGPYLFGHSRYREQPDVAALVRDYGSALSHRGRVRDVSAWRRPAG